MGSNVISGSGTAVVVSVGDTTLFGFAGTQLLADITLGKGFHIKDNAAFGDAGSLAGDCWTQVQKDGSVGEEELTLVENFQVFHADPKRSGDEPSKRYVRRASQRGVSGGCAWEYVPSSSTTFTLRITPLIGTENQGKLDDWSKELSFRMFTFNDAIPYLDIVCRIFHHAGR